MLGIFLGINGDKGIPMREAHHHHRDDDGGDDHDQEESRHRYWEPDRQLDFTSRKGTYKESNAQILIVQDILSVMSFKLFISDQSSHPI